MNLPEELVTELVKVTSNNTSNKDNNTAYGTVVDNGDRLYVRLDGADASILTPVVITSQDDENTAYGAATIKNGDRVMVSIRNHSAVIVGNVKDPSASVSELLKAIKLINSVDEEVNGIGILLNGNGEVEGLVAKVNQNGIAIGELGTKLTGYVTFESLKEGGTTEIDGSRIITGTIDVNRINMTGVSSAISWGSLNETVKKQITNAQSAADDAYELANTADDNASDAVAILNYLTDSEETADGTYIDGAKIATGSIYTNALHLGGKLIVYQTEDVNDYSIGGYLGYDDGFSSTEGIGIRNDDETGQVVCTDEAARLSYGIDNQVVTSKTGIYFIANAGSMHWKFYDEYIAFMNESYFGPYKGIAMDLGHTNAPWSVVYADTCTGTTSNRDKKNSIENLPEKYVTMFDSLIPRRFKMNNGTSDRYHVGYIAQEVEDAMNTAGVDSQEFGGFIRDKDDEGNDIFMLRYGEFDGIYAAKIKQLEARIDELEKRLKAVEEVS